MKKLIALLLTIVLTGSLFSGVVMAEKTMEPEEIIKSVKEKITIPPEFTEFDYRVHLTGTHKSWILNWTSNKNDKERSLNVTMDEEGRINSYSFYKSSNTEATRKLPNISKSSAKLKAEEFIKKVNPEAFEQIKEDKAHTYYAPYSTNYQFQYYRVVNGIKFNENNVSIEIDRDTGEVSSYYINWSDNIEFPSPDKAITVERAQEIYKDMIGIKLNYMLRADSKEPKTELIYKIEDTNKYVNALSEEIVTMPLHYMDKGGYIFDALSAGGAEYSKKEEVFTPQEVESIQKASKLIAIENAEKIARESNYIELDKDFKLTNSYLNTTTYLKSGYVWEINFAKTGSEPGTDLMVNFRIDAVTGKILTFGTYDSQMYSGTEKPKFKKDQLKELANSFINKEFSEYLDKIEYTDESISNNYTEMYPGSRENTFRFVRKENDVPFYDNYINVRYDNVTGKLVGFEFDWYDVDFSKLDLSNAKSLDEIYSNLFKELPLELQYKIFYTQEEMKKMRVFESTGDEGYKTVLVYTLKDDENPQIDPSSGMVKKRENLESIKTTHSYSDIDGSFAKKQITELEENGIFLEGTEFKPNESIKQKDFVTLLARTITLDGYYVSPDSKTAVSETYATLVRIGLLKKDEIKEEANLTREEAVKFIIRALKYEKVADIKDIFNCPFKDKDSINPELIGYVTIAKGLGLVNGDENGNFMPKKELTRAQMMIIIYNYMKK